MFQTCHPTTVREFSKETIRAFFGPLLTAPDLIIQDIHEDPRYAQDNYGHLQDAGIPGFLFDTGPPIPTQDVKVAEQRPPPMKPAKRCLVEDDDMLVPPSGCYTKTFLYAATLLQSPELTILPWDGIRKKMLPLARDWGIPSDTRLSAEDIESAGNHLGMQIIILESDRRTVTSYATRHERAALLIEFAKRRYALHVFPTGVHTSELNAPVQDAMDAARLLRESVA